MKKDDLIPNLQITQNPHARNPHGGNLRAMAEEAGCQPEQILDFSANLNPLGFPDWLRQTISSRMSDLIHYPDPHYLSLKTAIGARLKVQVSQITVGNGASELLHALPQVLRLTHAILPIPSYAGYERALQNSGVIIVHLPLQEEKGFALDFSELRSKLEMLETQNSLSESFSGAVFLGNPNNPTGQLIPFKEVQALAQDYPRFWFILDESFIGFVKSYSDLESLNSHPSLKNILSVHSMTKILAIPGLRVGFLVAQPEVAQRVEQLLPTWSVNSLAAAVLERAISEETYFEETRHQVNQLRNELVEGLKSFAELKVYENRANFILVQILSPQWNSDLLRTRLLSEYQIGIRSCTHFPGLNSQFFRLAVNRRKENHRLLDGLTQLLTPTQKLRKWKVPRKTPALMFQGTGSNVGKSILTTALCRILRQDGIQVAPFKAQNMALNSFVTSDGGEIGRAQALQAQAAGLLPDVRMNPVLLKPSSERGSQIIVNGKPVRHMDFTDYSTYKSEVFEEVKRSYDSLSAEYEAIILEGAGSASEVNLKKNDIVNMRMAKHADASVLLVGNIDQGGVFGAFVGTLETMAEWERERVAGFVINRFRGIQDLLKDGVSYLHRYTGKPVLGIVPHIKNLNLPEEDSLEFKSGILSDETPLNGRIDIALIDTPRISNFTDLDALRMESDVRVRHVQKAEELKDPDVIVLGGSKSVVSDLQHLRQSGIVSRILERIQQGRTWIVGICGGYQMLGTRILDPHQLESEYQTYEGLGLLPIETTLEQSKHLSQTRGKHLTTGCSVSGYEIHHGVTTVFGSASVAFVSEKGETLGHQNENERIWGTYLHGVFDSDEFRRTFLNQIRREKGLPALPVRVRYDLEARIDELANHVRRSMDMKAIYQKLRL